MSTRDTDFFGEIFKERPLRQSNRELKHRRPWAANGNRKLISFLLTRFDTIASAMASHQASKQEFFSPRQVAETVQQKEQLTSGYRSWLTDVCA